MANEVSTVLCPALLGAFPEPFTRFGQTLAPPRPGAVPLPQLLQVAFLPGLARRGAAEGAPCDARAALSLWSQYYLLALVPCATAAALVAGRDLPVALGGMAAVLGEDGRPECLCLPHRGGDTALHCPVRRMAPLLHGHLVPLAASLAAAGLPPRVFWSNAAAVLSWSLGVVAAPEGACHIVRRAMTAPCWADGAANPFCAVLGNDPGRRRVCCLRFRLPGIARCGDCPATCRTGCAGLADEAAGCV